MSTLGGADYNITSAMTRCEYHETHRIASHAKRLTVKHLFDYNQQRLTLNYVQRVVPFGLKTSAGSTS